MYIFKHNYYTGFCFVDKLPSYSEVCETPDSTQAALTQTQPVTNQTEQSATDSQEIDGTAEGQVDQNNATQVDQQDVSGHELPSSEGNNHVALTLAEFIVPEDSNIMSSPSA